MVLNYGFHLFQAFQLEKGDLLIDNCIIVFLSIYRVLLWVLWETTNSSKLGLSEGFPAQLCGFLGVGKGSLYQFKVICLGVSN